MLSSTAVKEGNPGWGPGLGQIAATAGILGKGEADRFNRCRLRPNESELFMTLKMTRRRFAGSSVAAAASVWARPVLGETREAAGFVNPLIGASTSQKLGEGKDLSRMEGFSFTHMSGVGWCGDFGNLLTMPTTGPLEFAAGRSEHPDEGWRSPFS